MLGLVSLIFVSAFSVLSVVTCSRNFIIDSLAAIGYESHGELGPFVSSS